MAYTGRKVLQNAASGTGDGTALNMAGQQGLSVAVTGTFTATVTFEGSLDGTNWFAVALNPAGGGAAASTATAAGLFYMPDDVVLFQFRARVSAYTSGNVTVTAIAS